MSGVPVRPVVLTHSTWGKAIVVSRGDAMLALPTSIIGNALANAAVGTIAESLGIAYERCSLADVNR